MPNPELLLEYRKLLERDGLSLHQTSKEDWIKILRLQSTTRTAHMTDAPPIDDAAIVRNATELTELGGMWNRRYKSHVPALLSATNEYLTASRAYAGWSPPLLSDDNMFFAEFPTGSFNAHVRKASSGYLILLNSGLGELLSLFSRVIPYARRFDPDDRSDEMLTYCAHYCVGIAQKYRNGNAFSMISSPLARVSESYADVVIGDWVVDSMIAFALSHELAHILLKHTESPSNWLLLKGALPELPYPRNWVAELSADIIGALILKYWCANSLENSGLPPEMQSIWLTYSIVAPILFFYCDRLVAASAPIETYPVDLTASTHPPTTMRQRVVMNVLRQDSVFPKGFLFETHNERLFLKKTERVIRDWNERGDLEVNAPTTGGDITAFKLALLSIAKQNGIPVGDLEDDI